MTPGPASSVSSNQYLCKCPQLGKMQLPPMGRGRAGQWRLQPGGLTQGKAGVGPWLRGAFSLLGALVTHTARSPGAPGNVGLAKVLAGCRACPLGRTLPHQQGGKVTSGPGHG